MNEVKGKKPDPVTPTATEDPMWTFLNRIINYLFRDFNDRLDVIIQSQIRQEQILMGVKATVEQFAAQVNGFSNELAAAVATIAQQFADLNAKLVDASTPEEVQAILATPLANLGAVKDSLVALAAGNQPAPPPPVPPVDPVEPL